MLVCAFLVGVRDLTDGNLKKRIAGNLDADRQAVSAIAARGYDGRQTNTIKDRGVD